jgi:hypothetical protein
MKVCIVLEISTHPRKEIVGGKVKTAIRTGVISRVLDEGRTVRDEFDSDVICAGSNYKQQLLYDSLNFLCKP